MKKKKPQLQTRWSLKRPLYYKPKDKRYKKSVEQLKTRGFSDEETYALYEVIAEFSLPRLKRFKVLNNGHPMDLTSDQWDEYLEKMIFSFEFVNEEWLELRQEEFNDKYARHKEGLELFGRYFEHLWW